MLSCVCYFRRKCLWYKMLLKVTKHLNISFFWCIVYCQLVNRYQSFRRECTSVFDYPELLFELRCIFVFVDLEGGGCKTHDFCKSALHRRICTYTGETDVRPDMGTWGKNMWRAELRERDRTWEGRGSCRLKGIV